MLRRSFAVVLFSLLLLGCRQEVTVPSEVLPAEVMVPLLIDIHVLEGARNGSLILGDTNTIEEYYVKVYDKHGVEEAAFKQSFVYYSNHPELFIPIYEAVVDSLKVAGAIYAKKGVELDYE